MDLIRVGLVRCTLEEWEYGETTGEIALTGERILVEWQGHRSVWAAYARPQLVAAIKSDHDGLYCLINGFGDLVQAAFQPITNADDDELYEDKDEVQGRSRNTMDTPYQAMITITSQMTWQRGATVVSETLVFVSRRESAGHCSWLI